MNAVAKEQWIQPAPVPKVYQAIVEVMKAIGTAGISKDRKNQQQGYQFRGIDDVYNALNAIMADNRLCVLPRVTKREANERLTKDGKGTLFCVVLEVEYDFVSAEDGSKHTAATAGEAMDSGDKATSKAMSAAYKYACMQVFCIPTEGNPDADSETHEVAPRTGQDPRGDLGKNVPPAKVQETVKRMIDLMDGDIIGDHEGVKKAMIVLDYHEKVLNPDEDLYVAVGEVLTASKKNAWKAFVAQGKRLEKEDAASDPSRQGRKF